MLLKIVLNKENFHSELKHELWKQNRSIETEINPLLSLFYNAGFCLQLAFLVFVKKFELEKEMFPQQQNHFIF